MCISFSYTNYLKKSNDAGFTAMPEVIKVTVPTEEQIGRYQHADVIVYLQIAGGTSHVVN